MGYSFKKIKLSNSEKLWLKEMYLCKDVKKAKVTLWGKLSENFNPQEIDNKLFRNDHLTLIGIWHVNPKNPVFEQVDEIIKSIKELININPGIDKITASEISKKTEIKERDVEIGLYLMSEIGRFFSSAEGISKGIGYSSLKFSANEYDEYLAYNNLDDLMEKFYSQKPPELSNSLRENRIGSKVFIGHGKSPVWKDLKDFIQDRLHLPWDEFNRIPAAGVTNIERLSQMLDETAIAFLIMTGEDERIDGKLHARTNVVHEAGLFQGRLGFKRAIILLEDDCEEFSNIHGLGQIRFPKGNIKAIFEDIRKVLEREKLVE